MTRYVLIAVLLSAGATAHEPADCPPCPCEAPAPAAEVVDAYMRAMRALEAAEHHIDSDGEVDVYDTASERPGVPRPAP